MSQGAKSVISRDMQELAEGRETVSNTVRGHKANLANPSTSEKSKENSVNIIKDMGGDASHYGEQDDPTSKGAAELLEGSRAMGE